MYILSYILQASANPTNTSTSKSETQEENTVQSEGTEVSENETILQDRIDTLQQQILDLEHANLQSQTQQKLQEQHIFDLSVIIDNRRNKEERSESIQRLHQTGQSSTLPFYYSILVDDPDLAIEIINGLHFFSYEEEIGQILKTSLSLDTKVALRSVEVLGELQLEELIPVLEETITSTKYPKEIRDKSIQVLQESYPKYVEDNGIPTIARDESKVGNQFFAISTGITSSVVLGSIGQWGKTDVGEGIGYYGGFALGYTGGLGFARQNTPSLGQSLMYTSSISWGLIQGNFVAHSFDMNNNWQSFSRTVGTISGLGYGYYALKRDATVSNVLELDFMGYWGAQMAVGIRDIVGLSTDEVEYPILEPDASHEDYDVAWQNYDVSYQQVRRYNNQAALVGSTLGLATGHIVQKHWNVTKETAWFGGVYATELAIASDFAINAFEIENDQGYVRTAIHTGLAGALLYEHFHPSTYHQSAFTAYGAFAGNLLGGGIPSLFKAKDKYIYHGAMWTGLTGSIVGTAVADHIQFEKRDWVFNAVGVPASAWQFTAMSEILAGHDLIKGDQEEGLISTGIGTTVLGLSYLSTKYQIDTYDSLFAGSSMAWGAYYGGLLPLALGINQDLESHDHLLFALASSDLFLTASCISMKRGYASQQSFFPQITAVAGATLASLGTFLFTDQQQPFGIAALSGSTAGFIIGNQLQKNGRTKNITLGTKRNIDVSSLKIAIAPQIQENGDLGFFVGIHN